MCPEQEKLERSLFFRICFVRSACRSSERQPPWWMCAQLASEWPVSKAMEQVIKDFQAIFDELKTHQ